jgi:hypothetical protein
LEHDVKLKELDLTWVFHLVELWDIYTTFCGLDDVASWRDDVLDFGGYLTQ